MKWKSIRAGTYIACGVTVTGGGYCWGDNFEGAFGSGVTVKAGSNRPVAIVGSLVFDQVVVDWHGCGLTVAGTAYCWGMGSYGQIGDGDLRTRWQPVKVSGQK
jgi:alpha-tubulin suppressor-like RCC1 family protein